MRLKIGVVSLILGLCLILGQQQTALGEEDGLLSIENQYIKIFINNSNNETGRFAIDVTQGDPNRTDDDHKPLIYGHPKPWTSFSTVRINNQNYVFGKATTKRSGKTVPAGEIVEPPHITDNQISMKCKFGAVTVEQIMEIAHSPSTGALDTARIKYIIHNSGDTPSEVGLRTVLDTLVGNNDGAPFRVGTREITRECSIEKKDLPDYWQAFDSMEHPSVIAQGTLKGADVTSPDQIVFTNWGKAADYPWEIPLESGATFIRSGEDELDSAVTMFWQPQTIQPNQNRTIVIYCGLGGVTFSPGKTFLGISAPEDIQYTGEETRSYTVMTYIEHRGETTAKNVTVNLDLPAGISLVNNQPEVKLGELEPGVTRQLVWEIQPDGLYTGDTNFRIRVVGDGLEPNQVTRKIVIDGPIGLGATLTLPKLKVENNQWEPNPFKVDLKLQNLENLLAQDIKVAFQCDDGLALAEGECSEKPLSDLDPGKNTTVSWQINPLRAVETGHFRITVTGSNTIPLEIPGEIAIPVLPARIGLADPGLLQKGQVFSVDLDAFNLYNAKKYSVSVQYDPKQIRLVYVSRGTFLVEDGQLSAWSSGKINITAGRIEGIGGSRMVAFTGDKTTLAQLNFEAVGSGNGEIKVEKLTISDGQDKAIPYEVSSIKYEIAEEKP